jgi:hypothetical protein
MIKIYVGPEKRPFVMHEAALTARSCFFAAAMKGNWKEAQEKVVRLVEDDPDAFALYEQLVYTGSIPAMNKDQQRFGKLQPDQSFTSCLRPELCAKEYEALCGLYVLATKLQDEAARDSTVNGIVAKFKEEYEKISGSCSHLRIRRLCFPSTAAINTMYNNTATECGGRKAIVAIFARYGHGGLHEKMKKVDGKGVSPGFLWDLTHELFATRTPCAEWEMPNTLDGPYYDEYFELEYFSD